MDTPKRQILIADRDETTISDIARGLSEHHAFEIRTATSGQAALEELKHTTFDLLVVARQLTDMDGQTLLQEAHATSPKAITVLMTTVDVPGVQSLRENGAADHFIEKPFAVADFINIVDSIFPPEPAESIPQTPLVIKVALGGDANVGKTSLIQRYCHNDFDPEREMTIGVDFHLYEVSIEGAPVRLVVWDFGGQERFAFARQAFYRGTHAVGLVFDSSNRVSFYNLMRWWREARESLPDVPILLLANKTDLPRQVSRDESLQIAQAWNVPFLESSCVNGEGVKEFFEALAHYAWKHTTEKKPAAIAK